MSEEERQSLQDDEKLVIESIFCEDAVFAQQKWKVWHPLEVTIHLKPPESCSTEPSTEKRREVSVDLHVACSREYPTRPPNLEIRNIKGISLDTSRSLLELLKEKAKQLVGNAMIMDLCDSVKDFLARQDNRAVLSFHETMMRTKENAAVEINRKRLDSERRELELVAEEQERIAVERQLGRQEILLKDHRMEGECRMIGGRRVVVLANIPIRDRKLHNFCKEWMGFWDNSQLLISEWTFRHTLGRNASDAKKRDFEPFVRKLEETCEELNSLCKFDKPDPNLVEYSFIHVQKTAVTPTNLFVQIFVGQKIYPDEQNMLDAYQMVATNCSLVRRLAAQAVCGLRYLHEQQLSHSALSMCSVWLREHVFRFSDFATLHAFLNLCQLFNDLVAGKSAEQLLEDEKPKRRDLFQLGTLLDELLIEARSSEYSRVPSPEISGASLAKFIAKCQEAKNIDQLVDDQFLNHDVPISGDFSDDLIFTSCGGAMGQQSRVMKEFVVIRMLGKGGFGDVLLARNKMDSMDYAVKRIPLNAGNERLNRRIKKEAKLFAKLNHPNVVRYFSAWAEDLTPIDSQSDTDSECAVPIPGKPKKPTKKSTTKPRKKAGRESISEDPGDSLLPPQLRAIEREAAKAAKNRLKVVETSEWSTSYRAANHQSSSQTSGSDEEIENENVQTANKVQTLFSPSNGGLACGGGDDLDNFWDDSEKEEDEEEEEETGESSIFEKLKTSESDSVDIVFGEGSSSSKFPEKSEIEESPPKPSKPSAKEKLFSPKVLIIQMEYCEKGTLRQLIDEEKLINNQEVCWRIFSEILCGLQYIHMQGMIHRDIKPLNIFLNSQQNVKIGDFGLATKDFIRDRKRDKAAEKSTSFEKEKGVVDQTRDIGTQLYMAPELFLEQEKGKLYTSKIDVFSCGVVLFEMFYRPLLPGMERISTIEALKKYATLPVDFGTNLTTARKTIEWMLKTNPDERPTVDQLLNDENLPMNKGEDAQFQKQFQRIIKKRGSRQHNWIINQIFNEEIPVAVNYCYDAEICKERFANNREQIIENLREEFGNILKSHAYELMHMHTMTLCSTARASAPVRIRPVEFMDKSGTTVALPIDLRQNFVRFCARNAINRLKRYNFGRVYWADDSRGTTHPQERWECSVDSIGLRSASISLDAEILLTACQLISTSLKGLKMTLRIGHIQLIDTALRHLKVSDDFRGDVLNILHCFSTSDKTLQFPEKIRQLGELIGVKSATSLLHCLPSEPSLVKFAESLRHLLKSRDEPIRDAATRCIKELSDIFEVFKIAAGEEITSKFNVVFDAATSYRPRTFGDGLVFQIVVEVPNLSKRANLTAKHVAVLAGGRYDSILLRERHPGDIVPSFPRCLTGFAILMDVVAQIRRRVGIRENKKGCVTVICSLTQTDGNLMLAEKFRLAKLLWSNNLAADVLHEPVESTNQLAEHCQKMSISHLLTVCNPCSEILVSSHQKVLGRMSMEAAVKTVCRAAAEHEDYLRLAPLATLPPINNDQMVDEANEKINTTATTPLAPSKSASQILSASNATKSKFAMTTISMAFVERTGKRDKKRIDSQVQSHIADEIQIFDGKTKIEVIACDVSRELIKKIAGEITRQSTGQEIDVIFDQLSRQNHGRAANENLDALCTQLRQTLTQSSTTAPRVFVSSEIANYEKELDKLCTFQNCYMKCMEPVVKEMCQIESESTSAIEIVELYIEWHADDISDWHSITGNEKNLPNSCGDLVKNRGAKLENDPILQQLIDEK
ncbi:unnamed protein product [Caenorhabditis angaria]|uniref:non-specific serine/threonine protein kinase n=1 Tax=Caenorhabditis angaria TaxID=860376 RepID=A0A9P1I980_9PELO|nr:unnamed protein product [Caenorhabditis angaria]